MLKIKALGAVMTFCLLAGAFASDADAYRRYGPERRARWGYRHRPHMYAGGQLMGYGIATQVTDYRTGYLGHGGGGGLFLGGRISPYFSLEGNWMMTFHDETFETVNTTVIDIDAIYLMSFTLDGKVHIPTFGPLEPYFQGGLGYALVGATYNAGTGDSVFANGLAVHLGGGVDFWANPWLSFGGRLLYRGIYLAEPNYDGGQTYDNFVNGFSLDVNATFHF
jgi:hypothetical protein